MTDFNKLADALESYTGDGHGYQIDDAVLREAARILRAAGAADVGGLMALHDAAAEARRVLVRGGDVPQDEADRSRQSRAALESALRVAMAPKPGFVMVPIEPTEAMLEAAHNGDREYTLRNFGDIMTVMQGPYDHWSAMIAASQAGAAQEPKP